jgi:AcrR family transcriptional regulator
MQQFAQELSKLSTVMDAATQISEVTNSVEGPETMACLVMDPRIRRTRELLQQALAKLLESKEFEKISVHDIAAAATVNRATFYAHYPDKFALLECMVGARFQALLDARGVVFNGSCQGALSAIVLGVCDFLAESSCHSLDRGRQMEPHMEAAVVAVVRQMLLNGLRQHEPESTVSAEMVAATASWAIYGAAKEWARTPNRPASEAIAETVVHLVAPILHSAPNA